MSEEPPLSNAAVGRVACGAERRRYPKILADPRDAGVSSEVRHSMTEITEFTPVTAALGGALIGGAAAVLLMTTLGRVSGISGILLGSVTGVGAERAWQWAFLAGIAAAAAVVFHMTPLAFTPREGFPLGRLIAGGLPERIS